MNGINWLAPLILALSACSPAQTTPPLAGAKIGGPFTLVSESGETVTENNFLGQYRLVYFGYTFCPDVCPVDIRALMLGLKSFEVDSPKAAAKLQPLFISVDPERDTPQVLAEYTNAFHPRLIGLTGSLEQVAATAKTFAIVFQKGESLETGSYLVDHSRVALLFDPRGQPLAIIAHDASPTAIAKDLQRWIN